ncbi:CAS1 domain-containing 1-like [Chlorella sorokiniana]|uniref:CAS1 domain-containing 1-like n=1 Tax=Chlorella sorokiniana TaxID=3076 RepID=A0A2P6U598_CHLSO|nr:CAS1 domain-containing 1-like [Chlorella sorokiniana]|eukprot:PRW61493.1 CAS1 domain-containing 1-like [Chlorella sorokiniana]
MATKHHSSAFKLVQLLASLTSIATCLFVVAHTAPQTGSRWPILAGSGLKRFATSASFGNWTGTTDGPALPAEVTSGGVPPNPLDVAAAALAAAAGLTLQDCLEAAREGHWRRVFNTSDRGTLPLDVASWSASDVFEYKGEMFSYEWVWGPQAATCGIRRRSKAEVAATLSGARLLLLGDSHVRYLHNWLATTLGGKELPKWTGSGSPIEINQTIATVNVTMAYLTRNYAIESKNTLQRWNELWPDVLVVDGAEWHLLMHKNLTAYAQTMQELLHVLRDVVPPSTFILWLSPPPRDEKKWDKPELPPEWIRLYDRVAHEVGFYKPTGPAYHLDLYQMGLDCLPWCTTEDGVHVISTVNEVLLQQVVSMLALRQAWPFAKQVDSL